MPLLFMTEINNNLGKTAIGLIKEALKKLKLGQISDIDLFTKEVSNNLLICVDSLSFLLDFSRFYHIERG